MWDEEYNRLDAFEEQDSEYEFGEDFSGLDLGFDLEEDAFDEDEDDAYSDE